MTVDIKLKNGLTEHYENVTVCEPKQRFDYVDGEEVCVGDALYIETESDEIGAGKIIPDTEYDDFVLDGAGREEEAQQETVER